MRTGPTTPTAIIDAARHGASCGGARLLPVLAKKLDRAVTNAETASSRTGRKALQLDGRARRLLKTSRKLAARLGRRRKPKLPTGCAVDLGQAISVAVGMLGPA